MFKAGKSQDGLEQTNCMMDFLDSNHPNDDHIFFFDNAKTHTACWPNALSAWHMLLKPSTSHVANWLCSEKKTVMVPALKYPCKMVNLLMAQHSFSIFWQTIHKLAYSRDEDYHPGMLCPQKFIARSYAALCTMC